MFAKTFAEMFTMTQHSFAAALLDPELPPPSALAASGAAAPAKRFSVYRNNVVVGLTEALRARFPVIEKLVDDDFFAATARVFVAAHPPRSPLLMHYGDAFADFLAAFPPAADLPYLPDVARLEAARTRAYHAADAAPLAPARLAGLTPEVLFAARLTLHPSLQIVRSAFPIVTIWAMNSGEAALAPVDAGIAEDALVARPRLQVLVQKLPPGGADFLAALAAGAPLGAAVQAAAARTGFDLAQNLAGLLRSGAIADLILPDAQKDSQP